ncbi:MAG: type II toxin-antitoxin system Phd/YefM family antitoxin, partial [Pseudonocardiaceae bacterium]
MLSTNSSTPCPGWPPPPSTPNPRSAPSTPTTLSPTTTDALERCTCSNMYSVTAAADREHGHPTIGMRELSQRTAKIMALVRAGATVEVTDRGRIVARIVPAADDRYA